MDSVNSALAGVVGWIQKQPGIALLLFAILQCATLSIGAIALQRTRRISQRQARLLRGADGESLEKMLLDYADNSVTIRSQLETAKETGTSQGQSIRRSLRRIGLVRFDAFPDIGGRQSFAVALLDDDRSGIIFSGLYSRHDMRVYAKPIVAGKSPILLTDEERRAVENARPASEMRLDDEA
jgi:hypothetical protein